MTPQTIYENALEKAKSAFEESNIFKKQKSENTNWGLSICATPIQIGKPIIIGINWGGGNSNSFDFQKGMPSKECFLKDYSNGDYTFLKKSQNFIREFLGLDIEKAEFNYTNLCFFRSPISKDLVYKDYQDCLPIFESLVKEINPPWILSLGNSNITILKPQIKEFKEPIKTAGTNHFAYIEKLWDYNFYCVPHPNARKLSNAVRYEIWKNVFPGK